jgi:hypothetical protein
MYLLFYNRTAVSFPKEAAVLLCMAQKGRAV